MFDQKSLQDNAARIAAFFVICTTLVFDNRSIAAHENQRSHKNFDIASAISPLASILNVVGRIMDHWDNPAKQTNIKMAAPLFPLLVLQMCFSTLSATHKLEQPIALPGLIGSVCLLFITGLNWEPISDDDENRCLSRLKKNAGRIGGIGFSMASMTAASLSIALDSKMLFFAATTANSVAVASESLSRVFDIIYFEREKTTLINKVAAIFFFGLVLVGSALSGLATANVWDQPIDLSSTLSRLHMLFYMVAQYKSSEPQESKTLLSPETPHREEDDRPFALTLN